MTPPDFSLIPAHWRWAVFKTLTVSLSNIWGR